MLERIIQQKIVAFSKQMGIMALKTDSTSHRGWPDLTVILPNGTVLFVEIKTKTGRLSKLQQHIHQQMRANNAHVYTVRSLDEFKRAIEPHITDASPTNSY